MSPTKYSHRGRKLFTILLSALVRRWGELRSLHILRHYGRVDHHRSWLAVVLLLPRLLCDFGDPKEVLVVSEIPLPSRLPKLTTRRAPIQTNRGGRILGHKDKRLLHFRRLADTAGNRLPIQLEVWIPVAIALTFHERPHDRMPDRLIESKMVLAQQSVGLGMGS